MIFAWFLVVLSVISGLGGLLVFLPRPTVTPNDPVDSGNPFSVSFTISNNGFVPLHQVSAILAIKNLNFGGVVYRGYGNMPENDAYFRLSFDQWNNHRLGIDERFTVSPAETPLLKAQKPPTEDLQDARIAVVVTYRPWFLPVSKEKEYRFKTFRQTNGHLYWYSEPRE